MTSINDKIKIVSFLCTVMVLFRHSRNLIAFFGTEMKTGYTAYIENSISIFTEIAVPFFFLISGYFFLKYDYYKNNNYRIMIKKKFKSLIVPFIFWNIVGAICLLFYNTEIIGNSITSCIKNLLMSEWNTPLWYVRDLIILMFLVPIYGWIYRINNKFLYTIIFFVLFLRWWPIDTTVLSTEGQLFFFIGGVIQKNKEILSRQLPNTIFIILFIFWCLFSLSLIPYDKNIHRINTIFGIIVFWRLSEYVNGRLYSFIYLLTSYSFIIYVMHSYIIKFIKRFISYFYSGNEFIALMTYIIVPFITIILIINIAMYWKKYMNKSYYIVTGGR